MNNDWTKITDDMVAAEAHEPWLINCPNPECGWRVTAWSGVPPSERECSVCGVRVEFAIRVASGD